MDEKRPKRRKDKDNPYTLSKRQDKHYLSFRDGQGVLRELLINKELFELLNCFELDDLSFLNEVDRKWIGITSIQSLPKLLYMTGRLFSRNRLRKRFFAICGMRRCTTL